MTKKKAPDNLLRRKQQIYAHTIRQIRMLKIVYKSVHDSIFDEPSYINDGFWSNWEVRAKSKFEKERNIILRQREEDERLLKELMEMENDQSN